MGKYAYLQGSGSSPQVGARMSSYAWLGVVLAVRAGRVDHPASPPTSQHGTLGDRQRSRRRVVGRVSPTTSGSSRSTRDCSIDHYSPRRCYSRTSSRSGRSPARCRCPIAPCTADSIPSHRRPRRPNSVARTRLVLAEVVVAYSDPQQCKICG
jgi:hypothetical protein